MAQLSFDDDELFTEAAEDMQTEIEKSVTAATSTLPSEDALVESDADSLLNALESIESEIDIDAVEAALTDVKKTFLLGQRADAFDSEYVSTTETTISELDETVTTLREIETATAELSDALSAYEPDSYTESNTISDDDDSPDKATEDSHSDSNMEPDDE